MKLEQLFKDDLGVENHIDKNAKPLKILNVFDKKYDYGKSTKVSRQKVVVSDTKTNRVYGVRTIWQREID